MDHVRAAGCSDRRDARARAVWAERLPVPEAEMLEAEDQMLEAAFVRMHRAARLKGQLEGKGEGGGAL